MFIALVRFPDIPTDRDTEFQNWFAWSNEQLTGAAGLRSRRLLHATDGGYCALVQHDTRESFAAMHAVPAVAQIQAGLREIVPEPPQATQFDVVSGPADGGCCAGDHHGHHDNANALASVHKDGAATDVALGHACCHSA